MLTWATIVLSAVVSIVVIVLTAYAVLHRKEDVRDWTEEKDRPVIRWIVIGGAVVPGVLLLVLFVATMLTLAGLAPMRASGPLAIELTGRQWWWQVRYVNDSLPQLRFESANEIHIPIGVRVPVRLTSVDVIHSFWVPELQGKIDLIPGRTTHTWLHAERPGVYQAKCAEYCGLQHTRMELLVIAHAPDEFEAWLAHASGPAVATSAGEPGLRVFLDAGCGLCHSIRGTPARAGIAPDLTHVGARLELAAGTVPNTRGHMAGWIANPQALKRGARMPRMRLTPEELHVLVDYLQRLE